MATLVNAPPEHETQTPVLLFFYSPTSGPSRRLDGLVSCLYVRERARLRVQRVDVSERRDVAERLGITTVPTLMLVKDRQVVAQLEGKITQQQIRDTFLPHLQREGRAA